MKIVRNIVCHTLSRNTLRLFVTGISISAVINIVVGSRLNSSLESSPLSCGILPEPPLCINSWENNLYSNALECNFDDSPQNETEPSVTACPGPVGNWLRSTPWYKYQFSLSSWDRLGQESVASDLDRTYGDYEPGYSYFAESRCELKTRNFTTYYREDAVAPLRSRQYNPGGTCTVFRVNFWCHFSAMPQTVGDEKNKYYLEVALLYASNATESTLPQRSIWGSAQDYSLILPFTWNDVTLEFAETEAFYLVFLAHHNNGCEEIVETIWVDSIETKIGAIGACPTTEATTEPSTIPVAIIAGSPVLLPHDPLPGVEDSQLTAQCKAGFIAITYSTPVSGKLLRFTVGPAEGDSGCIVMNKQLPARASPATTVVTSAAQTCGRRRTINNQVPAYAWEVVVTEYVNEINSPISRAFNFTVAMSCDFFGDVITPDPTENEQMFVQHEGTGIYTMKIQFTLTRTSASNARMWTFELQPANVEDLNGISYTIADCQAKPEGQPGPVVKLIKNGCVRERTTSVVTNGVKNIITILGFRIKGAPTSRVHVSCTVKFCTPFDGSPCSGAKPYGNTAPECQTNGNSMGEPESWSDFTSRNV